MPEPQQNDEQEENHTFVLEDVTVNTLGLVGKGAIGLDFFLTKSEDGEPMSEAELLDELTKTEDEGTEQGALLLSVLERIGLNRLAQLVKRGQEAETLEKQTKLGSFLRRQREAKEMSATEVAERMPITAGTILSIESGEIETPSMPVLRAFARIYDVSLSRLTGMLPEDTEPASQVQTNKEVLDEGTESNAEQRENKVEKDENEVDDMTEEITTEQAPVTQEQDTADNAPDIQAELAKRDEQITALMERLEKAEAVKDDLEKAQERVAEVEKAYQAERQARERLTYIEKARTYNALPVSEEDLAEFLHYLAEQDVVANVEKAEDAEDRSNRLGFVTELLKAVNEQIIQSGFFAETGSTKVPKDMTLIEKAEEAVKEGKYPTLKDALMDIDPAEAAKYLERYH